MTHDELLDAVKDIPTTRVVVELHKPKNAYDVNFCPACSPMGYAIFYPCQTIQAIEKELQ